MATSVPLAGLEPALPAENHEGLHRLAVPRPQGIPIQLFGYRSPRITVCPTTAGTFESIQAAAHYGGGRLGAGLDSVLPADESVPGGDLNLDGSLVDTQGFEP